MTERREPPGLCQRRSSPEGPGLDCGPHRRRAPRRRGMPGRAFTFYPRDDLDNFQGAPYNVLWPAVG